MSFISALFGGSNPTLNKDINQFGQIGGFATGQGQSDTTAASGFWKSILSGDQSQIAKVLAPQISAVQTQGNQQKKTNAEFGNRSGGTNASNQMIGDKSRSTINDMVSSLMSGAASNLGSMGTSLLNTGLSAYGQQLSASQQQMENWQNSIFGKGISSAVGSLESFGMDKLLTKLGSGGSSS